MFVVLNEASSLFIIANKFRIPGNSDPESSSGLLPPPQPSTFLSPPGGNILVKKNIFNKKHGINYILLLPKNVRNLQLSTLDCSIEMLPLTL